MATRRGDRNSRYFGSDGSYGAPAKYFTSGPARGPREAFLPPSAGIHPNFYADRSKNHGLFFDDDDNPNDDDYLLSHTYQARGWNVMPEELEEIENERTRRAAARNDVINCEKRRAAADGARSAFHAKEEKVEEARSNLRRAKDNDSGDRVGELKVKEAELTLRKRQEKCIAAESLWLAAEMKVERWLVRAEMNKIARYEERNLARERIEKVRHGITLEQAGRALSQRGS